MQIDPEYNNYFVYMATCHHGKQISCGARPVAWEDNVLLQKKVLTWADGNYSLYDAFWLSEDEVYFVDDVIYSAINETGETFGKIALTSSDTELRWCLLENEQVNIAMNIPELNEKKFCPTYQQTRADA